MGITQSRGAAGERLAAAYLELIGWTVEARNLRLGGVEIDLQAQEGGTQVLIEVKCRARRDFGGAARAVDRAKQQRLLRAAHVLAARGQRVRIDVVAIEWNESGATISHYRNAVAA